MASDRSSASPSLLPREGFNMAALLREKAVRMPHKHAVVVPAGRDWQGRAAYTHLTFAQLERESDAYARGFEEIGIRRGTRTVLMVTPGLEFFILTFALFKVGAVVVLIDPGIGLKNLGLCLAEAQPEAFVGVTKAHVARVLFRWGADTIKTCVTVGRRLFWGGWKHTDLRRPSEQPFPIAMMPADEMGAIMFTSGSTGISKGAVYTHSILTHQVHYIQELYDFRTEDVDLATFPLFALFDVCLGMTSVIPDMDATRPAQADPVKLIEAIEDNGATVMFGSPALINTLSRYGEKHGRRIPTIRTVISCGAPARNDVLQRLHKMLPEGTEIFTPYGATEALPVSSIGSREILSETMHETARGGGTCVGRPVPHVTVRVIKITDDPIPAWDDSLILPTGEVGEIVVKGPIVTREYYRRPEATALAKIRSADGQEIWHRMGDVGRFDGQGRLWFCGRKAHRVTTPQGPLFTIPCEAIFNAHPRVFRTALVGLGAPGQQTPALCVELEPGDDRHDLPGLRRELLALGAQHPHTRAIQVILFYPGSFPVDVRHNAKINRELLATWAQTAVASR
ncbi:MAG: AMP-dependent synthetase/ligase in alkane synthesis cluster [Candidatus Ozemobacter sibiricus]|uniref:AMP-dependent synthetase/ligase in alkane synthesis cluster n=1 Tax=Candidatus Ozemobacter sibiricus TaxID=2268124 RepID=A0A367ZLW8_9BACT|nr:MAG: AMP-dependent synthetase/ligase in alkane synthesis cluster [Candidatus Ozemobacter sibiricus]